MTIVKRENANVELKEAGIEVRAQTVDGWSVAFERWPAGDYSPLFKGLPGDACLAPHYGYCLAGRATAIWKDRKEEIRAGQAYVLQPGHTFVVHEEFESVEFTQLTPDYARVGEAFMGNFPLWLKARAAMQPRS